MPAETFMWPGVSGTEYKYWIYNIGQSFQDDPANYIFAKETSPGSWTPLYIGQTESLKDRLCGHDKLECVKRHGGTHIHAHKNAGGENVRKAEEADLIAKWNPSCNKQ